VIARAGRPHRSHVPLACDDRLDVADLLVLAALQIGDGTPILAGDVSGLARAA
jgi:hypothetical protein